MGYIKCIEHAVPYMKKNPLTDHIKQDEEGVGRTINCGSRGSIVNISSICGHVAVREFLPYNMSKTAELHKKNCRNPSENCRNQ